LIDDAKLEHIVKKNESSSDAQRWVATLSLAGRDLTGANLSSADVRHADFSGASLNHADLSFAWAEKARLDVAQLHGAKLNHAQLQGATLNKAQLQGASLDGAQPQGASLKEVQLQGASLDGAQLQGAVLDHAELQGAVLSSAQLQGASLSSAQLKGAVLDHAEIQGASLREANLQGASFVDVCVWRADARQAAWKDTRVARRESDPIVDKVLLKCDWRAASFAMLKQLIAKNVPKYDPLRIILLMGAVMDRIERTLDPTKALEGEEKMAEDWTEHERSSPAPEVYAKSLAGQWREVGCAAQGAPDVLHALVVRFSSAGTPIPAESDAAKALAAAFLDEAHCAGAHGLSEADKATLKTLAAPAAPPAPKP